MLSRPTQRNRGRGNGLRVRGEEATFVTSQPSAAFTLQVVTDEHWEFLSTCVSSEKCRLWLHSKQQLNSTGEPEPNSTEITAEGGGETSPPSSLLIYYFTCCCFCYVLVRWFSQTLCHIFLFSCIQMLFKSWIQILPLKNVFCSYKWSQVFELLSGKWCTCRDFTSICWIK